MSGVHSFFSKLNGFCPMIQANACDADHLILLLHVCWRHQARWNRRNARVPCAREVGDRCRATDTGVAAVLVTVTAETQRSCPPWTSRNTQPRLPLASGVCRTDHRVGRPL